METGGKSVLVSIYRPQLKKFIHVTIEVSRGTTILDLLKYVKRNVDGSLAFRYQCEMGSCGSCGVVVNGKPVLACQTEVLSLKRDKIVIKPLYNFPVIKDLVVDYDSIMFKKYRISPPMIKVNCEFDELVNPQGEFIMPPSIQEKANIYARCINCGICMAACPTISSNREFLGPYILLSIYRYYLDPRVGLRDKLLERAALREAGITACHYVRACTKACPEDIEVAEAIQRLKRDFFKNLIVPLEQQRLEVNFRPSAIMK
jgi:succinate dehydrogenase/fumarate reductase iron-sulfur protein